MTKKPAPPPAPEEKRYSPDAEMADILYRAAQQPQPPRIQDVLRQRRSEALMAAEAADKGGAPKKLPRGAAAEIRRRIARGEVKVAGAMAKKYPDAMKPRSWQRWVRHFRNEIAKTTKPTY